MGFWDIVLKQIYTLPAILIIALVLLLYCRKCLLPHLLFVQVVLAFWFGFSFYESWDSVLESISTLKMVNFSRFFFLTEILWAMIAAVVAKSIYGKLKYSGILLTIIIILQFYISTQASFFTTNTPVHHLPFKKYYDSEQFQKIKIYINRPIYSYKVIALGIEPAVVQYNGFYTIDGYMVNYPLPYKHEFRKIIESFIDENKFYKDLYDGWGSKLYLFDQGVTYDYMNELVVRATHTNSYKNLSFNTEEITALGAEYIFSAQKIKNPEEYKLVFLKTFGNNNSLWNVNLYRINIQ